MLEAFGWGLLAQSSLLVAGLLVCWVTVPTKVVGILGGFGAGAMIAAVSFDLLPEAQTDIEPWQTSLWMLLGVAVFLVADQLVERRFGSEGAGGAMGIVVGSVVDGVPESAILGIQLGAGITISLGFVAAVFISNIPQAIAPRPTWRQVDGARDGSASSGCSSSWPAASPPPSGSWRPTSREPCRATARPPSRQAACSRCSRTH
jgi:hypothetical protein